MRNEQIDSKNVTIILSEEPSDIAVFLNSTNGEYEEILTQCLALGCRPFNLILISNLDWDADLTPWPSEKVITKNDNFRGHAEQHLRWMEEKILPLCPCRHNILAGYSLAGLFSLFAPYRTDHFEALACGSASVWYPDFEDFILSNTMLKKPRTIYLSIGDRESNSHIAALQETIAITQRLSFFFQGLGIQTKYELNNGSHFVDYELRIAKAITHCANSIE